MSLEKHREVSSHALVFVLSSSQKPDSELLQWVMNFWFMFLSTGTWLPPDGATHVSGSTQLAKVEDTKPATSTAEHISNSLQIPSHLLSYYSHISKIILGNSENLVKVSMNTFGQSQDFSLHGLHSNVYIPCIIPVAIIGKLTSH